MSKKMSADVTRLVKMESLTTTIEHNNKLLIFIKYYAKNDRTK